MPSSVCVGGERVRRSRPSSPARGVTVDIAPVAGRVPAAARGAFALDQEHVAGIDPVRVGDPGVRLPQLRPEVGVAVVLLRERPERVAGLDLVRPRAGGIGGGIGRVVRRPVIADAMEIARRLRRLPLRETPELVAITSRRTGATLRTLTIIPSRVFCQ